MGGALHPVARYGRFALVLLGGLLSGALGAQTLRLPPRATNAPTGTEFAQQVAGLDLAAREREVVTQIMAGNVPQFLRRLCPVSLTQTKEGRTNVAQVYVTPDYLAIGADEDYLLMPMSPGTAQRLADGLGCSLPTRQLVDAIYAAAEVKLAPRPIPPSPAMTTVAVFSNHNALVRTQRAAELPGHPLGGLVAGDKKDVVICAGLAEAPGKVAIYGWHQTNGQPIQPLYLKHAASWVDYSQGIRLVQQAMIVDGQPRTVAGVLTDPVSAGLISDEGPLAAPRYPTNAPGFSGFQPGPGAQEQSASLELERGVKVLVNSPGPQELAGGKKVWLVFYALPNGNSTAQTFGKRLEPGDDWHFDIQQIGAQTRFVRERLKDRVLVVVYLENELRSWPAWRRRFGDQAIPEIIATVQQIFRGRPLETVLTGHSGGGSFIFGYLNAVAAIPDQVVRLAFLDSTYAYEPGAGHAQKLATWLRADPRHALCVLAYDDANALLAGKPFVSAAGGTWGKSHQMLEDLEKEFRFTSGTNAGLEQIQALDGRVQFWLKENPERRIWHTLQVERNGFIHVLLTGTSAESQGYEYLGARAYEAWLQ